MRFGRSLLMVVVGQEATRRGRRAAFVSRAAHGCAFSGLQGCSHHPIVDFSVGDPSPAKNKHE